MNTSSKILVPLRAQIKHTDINSFKSQIIREYLEDLIHKKSGPEASIVRVFQKLFYAISLSDEIQAGHGHADFLINTNESSNIILEVKKYLYYNPETRIAKPWNLNPFLNTNEMMNVKDQIFKYLDDPQATWKYLILTNMQDWYFYSSSDLTTKRRLKPFAVKTLKEVFDRFSDRFTISELERMEIEEKKRDLGEEFFQDLTTLVETLKMSR